MQQKQTQESTNGKQCENKKQKTHFKKYNNFLTFP